MLCTAIFKIKLNTHPHTHTHVLIFLPFNRRVLKESSTGMTTQLTELTAESKVTRSQSSNSVNAISLLSTSIGLPDWCAHSICAELNLAMLTVSQFSLFATFLWAWNTEIQQKNMTKMLFSIFDSWSHFEIDTEQIVTTTVCRSQGLDRSLTEPTVTDHLVLLIPVCDRRSNRKQTDVQTTKLDNEFSVENRVSNISVWKQRNDFPASYRILVIINIIRC